MTRTLNSFSAAPSVVAFIYQIRLGLLAIVERIEQPDCDEDRLGMTIEKLDDVALMVGDDHERLIQAKSHIDPASLTDGSEELWKTIRVWIEAMKAPNASPQLIHCLFTTATASRGSACELLRPGADREIDKALELLNAAAMASEAEALKKAIAAWNGLSEEDKRSLVASINVLDRAPNASELLDQIAVKLFRYKSQIERCEMVARLEGWWIDRVIAHLFALLKGPGTDVIKWAEVRLQVTHIMSQFGLTELPNEFGSAEPDEPVDPDKDARLFVHQLRAIGLGRVAIRAAIRDQWRAAAQRSSWTRKTNILPWELDNYDKKLFEEWELVVEEHGTPADFADIEACKQHGQKVFWAVAKRHLPLRTFIEPFWMRGSYHKLADHPARLGWHPKWESECASWNKPTGK